MIRRAHLGERAATATDPSRHARSPASRFYITQFAAAHEYWAAAALFALVVVVYLWPALTGDNPLLPASVLYQLAPWTGVAPGDIANYYNPSLVDVPVSYYPWDVLARHYVHAGTFPAWNPYVFAGTPFFANPEVAWLSPFTWVKWVLPLNYSLGFVAAVKLWLAGFGTYLLIRELRLGFWPAVVAGLSFAFCTFNVVWLSYGVHVTVAVLLPWAVWLAERVVRRGRGVDGLGLLAVVALIMTGGHPGTQLHVMSALVLYASMRVWAIRDVDRRDRIRRLGIIGGALLLGTLVAAVTLLPAQQAAVDTAGAMARRGGSKGFPGSTLSFEALRAVVFPDWWGRPSEAHVQGPGNYSERALFAGVIPLLLAGVGLVSAGGWRRKAPFVTMGAIGLAVGLRVPVVRDAVVNAPLFDLVQNQRMLLLFLFAIAVLSAFGLQAVLDGGLGRRRAWGITVAGIAMALLAAMTVTTASGAWHDAIQYFLHRSGDVVDGVLPLASIGWFLVFAVAFGGFLAVLGLRPRQSGVAVAALVAVVSLEMLHFGHDFQAMGPAARAIPPHTPSIAFLQEHRDEGRIAGIGYAIPSDWTTIYGLRDARGYDAPQPSLRFHQLWTALSPEQTTHTAYAFSALSPEALRVLSVLGARYILGGPDAPTALRGVTVAYRGSDATVFANRAAMPPAVVAQRVHVAGDVDEEVAAALEAGFDPRRDAVVRSDEVVGAGPDAPQRRQRQCARTAERAREAARSSRPARRGRAE